MKNDELNKENIFHPSHVEEHIIRMFLVRYSKTVPGANIREKFMFLAVIFGGVAILIVGAVFIFVPNNLIPLLPFGISVIVLLSILVQIKAEKCSLEKIMTKTQESSRNPEYNSGLTVLLIAISTTITRRISDEAWRIYMTILIVIIMILFLVVFSVAATTMFYRVYLIKKYCPYLITLEDRRYVTELPEVKK